MPGTGHEELCESAIATILVGDVTTKHFSDFLVLGPGFVHALTGDQRRFPYGKATPVEGTSGGRQFFFLAYRVMGDDILAMFNAPEVRPFLQGFHGGKAEPATREQRRTYYALIPFEIAGQPVSVIRDGERCLLLQAKDGKIFWVDMIDQYPIPSVAGSTGEAMQLVENLKPDTQRIGAESETSDRIQGLGIAQVLTLLLLGLLVDIVARILLLAARVPFTSAPSMIVPQVLMWAFLIWSAAKMGGRVRRSSTSWVSSRLVPPVLVASVGAAVILPQIAGLLPMPQALVEQARKLKEIGPLPLALSLGLIAPIAEEIFFRGIVLPGFLDRYSVRKAIWASAIIFAVAHLDPWQAIIALPLGGAYAYLVIRTGSIWPGVLSHAVVNLAHNFLTPNMLKWLGHTSDDIEQLTFLPYQILVFGVVALVMGGVWLMRELDRQFGPGTIRVAS